MKTKPYTSVLWYLVTDSMQLRHAAVKRIGKKKIVTSLVHTAEQTTMNCNDPGNTNDGCVISQADFDIAAAEWWLLDYADYHVITRNSGYGRSGAFRTLTSPDRIYTIHEIARRCEANNYTPLEKLMNDWSGI